MSVRIVDGATRRVVGIEVTGSFRELWTKVPEAWRTLRARAGEIEGRLASDFLDVSLKKEGDLYTQVVGAEVGPSAEPPEGMVAVEVPPGRWAVGPHSGPLDRIPQSFGRIYDWAAEHGHAATDLKLDVGYTAEGDETEHELHVRLE